MLNEVAGHLARIEQKKGACSVLVIKAKGINQ
jgi:hypothetical protein